MAHGDFIWADLSTFRMDVTTHFYSRVMGWSFFDGLAHLNGVPVANLFTMPDTFQKIGMPSFWMSYIEVDDVETTVAAANTNGGKVELGPEPFEKGQIALIRDPLGAGFTVYAGPPLGDSARGTGARLGHGLFVSDINAVAPFYTALFGWSFEEGTGSPNPVSHGGRTLFFAHEIPDPAIRGKEEYWGVLFASADLSHAARTIVREGGSIVSEMPLPEGPALLARDPDGGAFFVVENPDVQTTMHVASSVNETPALPLKAWLGILLILISSFTLVLWPWAVFLLVWLIAALRDGETYLFERIGKGQHPKTFWSLTALYGVLFALVVLIEADRFFGPF